MKCYIKLVLQKFIISNIILVHWSTEIKFVIHIAHHIDLHTDKYLVVDLILDYWRINFQVIVLIENTEGIIPIQVIGFSFDVTVLVLWI